MTKNLNCTTSASQSSGSLLATTISSSTMQNASSIILPYADKLATGSYTSKILAVDEGIYQEKPYLDCIHELTDPNGEVKHVKFRFFATVDTDALFKKLADYKLVGTVADVLVGLEENITIAPRPGSTKYVYISDRALVTPSPSSPPPDKKPSPSGKRIYFGSQANRHSKLSTREALLDDGDEDDDFDDFDDFDESDDE